MVGWLSAVFGRCRLELLWLDNFLNVGCRVGVEKELRRENRTGAVEGIGVAVTVADVESSFVDLKPIGYSKRNK